MKPSPLRIIRTAAFSLVLAAPSGYGQVAASHPAVDALRFDVASVVPTSFPSDVFAAGFRAARSSNPCSAGDLSVSGTLVTLTRAGICDVVRIAYDVKNYQVLGVPPTLGSSGQDKPVQMSVQASMAEASKGPIFFYDIEARAPGATPPTDAQVREMLRTLLADRFHLSLHREDRELSFYALVPAKNGPKLTPAAEGCKTHSKPDLMTGCGRTLEQMAKMLTARTDRMVLDKTGVTTKFDYEIPINLGDGDLSSTVLSSVLEQLKLKLEPRKGPLECLIIDHVERPSEN